MWGGDVVGQIAVDVGGDAIRAAVKRVEPLAVAALVGLADEVALLLLRRHALARLGGARGGRRGGGPDDQPARTTAATQAPRR
jgi:hypothetical protein